MALTSLGIVALGLLSERPMHPYEMYGLLLKRREDELVKIRPGSLYHTVDRLVRDGFAEPVGTEREGNRPERTTYAITQDGRDTLSARLMELLRTPVNEYPSFPLALGEAHNLDPDTVVDLLSSYRAQLDAQLVDLDAALHRAGEHGVVEAHLLDVHYLKAVKIAERDWLSALLTRICEKDIPWPQ